MRDLNIARNDNNSNGIVYYARENAIVAAATLALLTWSQSNSKFFVCSTLAGAALSFGGVFISAKKNNEQTLPALKTAAKISLFGATAAAIFATGANVVSKMSSNNVAILSAVVSAL